MAHDCPWDRPIGTQTARKVLELSNLDASSNLDNVRVLDFGCGNGRYLEVFARCIAKEYLFGTEVSADRVAQVRARGFFCFQLDPEESHLPFADESFDVVFSSNVMEHIPRELYLAYLPEIRRIMKTGGRFVVGVPNYPIKRLYDIWKAIKTDHKRYYLFDDPDHCNKMSIFRLEGDLKRVFMKVHLEPTHIFFQEKLSWLERSDVRQFLRIFGDKVSGYCVK
jgi:SAM-dependent methyltransferase